MISFKFISKNIFRNAAKIEKQNQKIISLNQIIYLQNEIKNTQIRQFGNISVAQQKISIQNENLNINNQLTDKLFTQSKKKDKNNEYMILKEEFKQSLIKNPFQYQDIQLITVLNSMLLQKDRDEQILQLIGEIAWEGKVFSYQQSKVSSKQLFRRVDSLTNLLYVFARFQFIPFNSKHFQLDFLETLVQFIIKQAQSNQSRQNNFSSKIICRNLWNFQILNYYNSELFKMFCNFLKTIKKEELNHQDVSNAIQSLSQFQHLDLELMTILINHVIQNMSKYSNQSLALICNSLAKLGVKNEVLFNQVSQNLKSEGQKQFENEIAFLEAIDCAQFITAFCRIGKFDIELFYLLEMNVLKHLKSNQFQKDLETLITIFCAHQAWNQHMLSNIKKYQSQFQSFLDYSTDFQLQFLKILVDIDWKKQDSNIKGIFLILSEGMIENFNCSKSKDYLFQIAISGVQLLKNNSKQLFGQNLGTSYELFLKKLEESEQNQQMQTQQIENEIWQRKYFETAIQICDQDKAKEERLKLEFQNVFGIMQANKIID